LDVIIVERGNWKKVRDLEDALAIQAGCMPYPEDGVVSRMRCDFVVLETAQATALESPAVPGKMADADSAPCCYFPQAVGK